MASIGGLCLLRRIGQRLGADDLSAFSGGHTAYRASMLGLSGIFLGGHKLPIKGVQWLNNLEQLDA